MKQKNNFIVYILLIQFFSLFSYEASHESQKTSPVKISVDNHQQTQRSNNFDISCNVRTQPSDFYQFQANYSVITRDASAPLKQYFNEVIAPMFCATMIKNHYYILPGYEAPRGLRGCITELSYFSQSDSLIIKNLKNRLETYCTRIENVLFSDKGGNFCHNLSYQQQTELIKIYANFLKEFYPETAISTFLRESQNNSLMSSVMQTINWDYYDGSYNSSKDKEIHQKYAVAAINGNLGAMHKAMQLGDSESAHEIGQQQVVVDISKVRKIEKKLSVFEVYPQLQKIVKQKYLADKAKAEEKLIAQKVIAQQHVPYLQEQYTRDGYSKIPVPSDALLQRCHAADKDGIIQFYQKLHAVNNTIAEHIHVENLTKDQQNIDLIGCHLQHQLVDEAITVIDTTISCDLNSKIQDAVIDIANVSLASNKRGDIITASHALDTCWAFIDFGKRAAGYTYTTLATHVPQVIKGIHDGMSESVHGVVYAVCHPIDTAQELAHSFVTVGYCLGKLIYSAAEYEGAADLAETHPNIAQTMMQKLSDESSLPVFYEYLKAVSTEDVARGGTKFVVEMMLLHGATKVMSSIAKESLPTFINCMRKGAQSDEVLMTVEGIPVRCSEEISSLVSNIEKASDGAEATIQISEIAKGASELLRIFDITKYDSSIGNLKKLEQALEVLKDIPGALTKDGPLFKVLEYGQRVEALKDAEAIAAIEGRFSTARGAMYEVEKAMELIESGEEIVKLGEKIGGREFDIVTKTKIIECKNIDWSIRIGKSAEKMRCDFGHWKSIAQKNGKIFELHSKNFIPQEWRDVLIKMGINFVEDNVL